MVTVVSFLDEIKKDFLRQLRLPACTLSATEAGKEREEGKKRQAIIWR